MSRRPFVAQLHETPGEMRFQGGLIDPESGNQTQEVFARETRGIVEFLTYPNGTARLMGEKALFVPTVFYLQGDNIVLAGSSAGRPQIVATQLAESVYQGHRFLGVCQGQRPPGEDGKVKVVNPAFRFG